MSENFVLNFNDYRDRHQMYTKEDYMDDYKGCSKEFRVFTSNLKQKLEQDIAAMQRELSIQSGVTEGGK